MMDVQKIMTTELMTVSPSQQVGHLHDLFNEVSYHHLPVVLDHKLIGIVSDRDVSHNLSPFVNTEEQRDEDEMLLGRTVAEIMSTDMITIVRDTSIDCASILLLENNISCLPVVDDEFALQGLLTWKDILKYHVYS